MSKSFERFNKDDLYQKFQHALNQKYEKIENEKRIPRGLAKHIRKLKAALREKGVEVDEKRTS